MKTIYHSESDPYKRLTKHETIDRPWGQFHYCSRSESICQRNLFMMYSTQSKLSELQREFIGRLKDLVEDHIVGHTLTAIGTSINDAENVKLPRGNEE